MFENKLYSLWCFGLRTAYIQTLHWKSNKWPTCEDTISQIYSEDANLKNIIMNERSFDDAQFLGTESMDNHQAGRKPGRGSKGLSHVEAETGLMYRSDTKPIVIAGSTVFTESGKVKGYTTVCIVLSPWIPWLKSFIQDQVQDSTLVKSVPDVKTFISKFATLII